MLHQASPAEISLSGLEDVLDKYDKVFKKHSKRPLIGVLLFFINIKQIRRKLEEMDKEVNRLKHRFMVSIARFWQREFSLTRSVIQIRSQIQQTIVAAQNYASLREELLSIKQCMYPCTGSAMHARESANAQCHTREMAQCVVLSHTGTHECRQIPHYRSRDTLNNQNLCQNDCTSSRILRVRKETSMDYTSEEPLSPVYRDAETQCEERYFSDTMTIVDTLEPKHHKDTKRSGAFHIDLGQDKAQEYKQETLADLFGEFSPYTLSAQGLI